jgi:hypothetical protein
MTDHVSVTETVQFVLNFRRQHLGPRLVHAGRDFTFQVRIPEGSQAGTEAYLQYIRVLPGVLVFEFPAGFVGKEKQKSFQIEIRVTDQDGKVDAQDPGCWTNPQDPATYNPQDDTESGEPTLPGQTKDLNAVKKIMLTNIMGEISLRSVYHE